MLKRYLIIFAAVVLIAVSPGCQKAENTPSIQAPSYAAAITETMLQALNSGDYVGYSLAFSDEMRERTSETVFTATSTFIQNRIGSYKSKKLSAVSVNGTETTVVYIAKFTKEPKDVTVTIVFQGSGDTVTVSGFWIVSPKLWEN
jgi:hypothetical protein